MWLATGHIGADLSKTISKKVLEIVLEAEILAPLGFWDFRNDKTPKALDFTGVSAFSIVWYFRLFCVNVGFDKKSWKFVGQAEDKMPKPLENTDYFGTPKIAKTRISNVISNTFQNHNLIRRNIEAVTTRRSWKTLVSVTQKSWKPLILLGFSGVPLHVARWLSRSFLANFSQVSRSFFTISEGFRTHFELVRWLFGTI